MISEGKIIGAITVYSTSETFNNEELDLLQTLAKDLAFVIGKLINWEVFLRKNYESRRSMFRSCHKNGGYYQTPD
uniref:GAF domain-containing protein n=1 Tax=Geoglobus ahangari TaxID=113653 RepID=A0A7C3UCQ9_9EURY